MTDERFPSGPWTGFYTHDPRDRHRMDLLLTFADGRLTGEGNDDIGAFTIKGHYDPASNECDWTKKYLGAHEVYYQGCREGKGIWGRWEINAFSHGGFHIWPLGAGAGETRAASVKQEKPVTAPLAQPVPCAQAPASFARGSRREPGPNSPATSRPVC